MKISGVVCEYNPFHNGHLHHIAETRKNGADRIVCVMSGNFVQRGDTAVIDKFKRADLAVRCGVDLVLELPVQYCLSTAEYFAKGAVRILDALGVVDEISFGSECGDIAKLKETMEAADHAADSEKLLKFMKTGYTYPKALNAALAYISPNAAEILSEPNNVLAVEYLRALKYFDSNIKPFTVKRSAVMTARELLETWRARRISGSICRKLIRMFRLTGLMFLTTAKRRILKILNLRSSIA